MAKRRLEESNSRCIRLERENELLTKRIQELNDELESSRVYIDSLLQRRSRDDEWKKKEKEYKEIISNLKTQIRGGEAMVSLALYRKAVDEARARAIECQDKRLEINAMLRNAQALERHIKDDTAKMQSRSTPPEARPSRLNMRKVTPTSSMTSDENCKPKTPNNVDKATEEVRPPPQPTTPRMSAVREAGGRKGLCAKLEADAAVSIGEQELVLKIKQRHPLILFMV